MTNKKQERRQVVLLGHASCQTKSFTQAEIEESERLKSSRTFNEEDQKILKESEGLVYVEGLTPLMMQEIKFVFHSASLEEYLEKYASDALSQNMRLFRDKRFLNGHQRGRYEEIPLFFTEDDIAALDEAVKSRGHPVHQFIHHLKSLTPNKKNKLMFSLAFERALRSARSVEELTKINSFDIRWIPGLEGYCFEENMYSNQRWLGRKNMLRYRKILLKKVLELAEGLLFQDYFKLACQFARYGVPRELSHIHIKSFSNLTSEYDRDCLFHSMFIHFGGRQDLICSLFKVCLSKASFEQCLKAHNEVHHGRVRQLAMNQLEKLASSAKEHWTVAQIAYRRKEVSVWKRHLKNAAKKA